MDLFIFWLMLSTFFFTGVRSACLTIPPLQFSISNVSLSKVSARRALGVSVGLATPKFPSQMMALSMNADWNNTIFYTTDGKCSNITTAQCTFDRGGAYNSNMSSSFQQFTDADGRLDAEFRPADNGLDPVVGYGKDMATIGTLPLPEINIFTPSTNTLPQSALGLGRNSTFIESLLDNQMVASRTWSLFWGLEGATPDEQMDGSLIFGGYDIAKTTGPNLTQAFSSLEDQALCPSSMIVDVTGLTLTFPNGTTVPLVDVSSTGFRACIKPDIPLLTLPTNIFTGFNEWIGGTYVAPSESYKLWGMDYATSAVFDGNLTYTISGGFDITIPNQQLVVPDVQVKDTGTTFIPDNNVRELLVYADPITGSSMPLLGQVFMTSAYLHVNNDLKQFTIWQANATEDQNIITVGDSCMQSVDVSGPRLTLNSNQYAGIAISGMITIAFSTLCSFWYLRRRRARRDLEKLKNLPWNNNMGINRFSKAELAGSTAKVPVVLKYELDCNAAKPLPDPPGWENPQFGCREVEGRFELPAERYHEMFS